jgi:hypothetical protein
MLRRSSPILVLGMIAVIASCDSLTSGAGSGTPISIALMNARTKGAGYTTSPRVNFYSVGSATFSFSSLTSDTCVTATYDSTAVGANSALQLGAGAYMIAAVSADTDSLYKPASGDQTYASKHVSGMPFTPGDSIWFNIAGDIAGFPAMQGKGKTAEPFTITRPVLPPANTPMLINWTPPTDNNAAMYISLIFNKGGGTALNTQVFCDFHDDGQGTVQSTQVAGLIASGVPFVIRAQRVRTNLVFGQTSRTTYMNIISTFEVPTPVSP